MSIGKLRARADELSREASLERSRCRAGLRNAVAILRRGSGSPAGLAVSFSLGFIAGTRRRGGPVAKRDTRARERVAGTLVSSVAKLLLAMISNSLSVAKVRGSRAVPEQEDQPSRDPRASAA